MGITIIPIMYASGIDEVPVPPTDSELFFSKKKTVQAPAEARKSQNAYKIESFLILTVL